MSTPYEYGTGTQVGNDFVSDQDGLVRFELRLYTADAVLGTSGVGGTDYIPWTTMVGDGLKSSLVDSSHKILSPPTPGLYLMCFNAEVAATASTTATTIKLVGSSGRKYCIYKGTLTTTSQYVNAAFIVPVGVVSGAIETFQIEVVSASQQVTFSYGSATNGNTFLQIFQLPVDTVSAVVQTIP